MSQRITDRITAFGLAAIVTLALLGGVDRYALSAPTHAELMAASQTSCVVGAQS
jgi:hypothetical protein